MPIDFFKDKCCSSIANIRFGICDNNDDFPAFLNSSDDSLWIATVLNTNGKTVSFTAIDNCIDFPPVDGNMQSRCDAMLTCDNCLYLVELKNTRSDWQSKGIEQLESTIQNLKDALGDAYYNFRLRKAYVANKRHPRFHIIENETMEKFRDIYKVRLDLQANISII